MADPTPAAARSATATRGAAGASTTVAGGARSATHTSPTPNPPITTVPEED